MLSFFPPQFHLVPIKMCANTFIGNEIGNYSLNFRIPVNILHPVRVIFIVQPKLMRNKV